MIHSVRMRTSRVLLCLLVLLFAPLGVFALHSLKCDSVWTGPSADNDIVACLSNKDRLMGQWRLFILPALNLLLFVVLLLSFPLLFTCALCCRCCCTPGTLRSTKRARCCMWLWISYAFLWSGVMFFLIYFGAGMLIESAPVLMNSTVSGPLNYFNSTAERVLDFASDWSTGERKPLDAIPLDLTDFSTVHEKAMSFVDLARRNYFTYLDKISVGTYAVASIGVLLLILLLPFAWFHCCIPCFPLLLSCLYWACAVIFTVLGMIVSTMGYASTVGCGELELQYRREPGVFQWYVVPYCEREFNFTNINREIRNKEEHFSELACGQLLEVCTPQNEINVPSSKLRSGNLQAILGNAGIGGTASLPIPVSGGVASLPLPVSGGGGGTNNDQAGIILGNDGGGMLAGVPLPDAFDDVLQGGNLPPLSQLPTLPNDVQEALKNGSNMDAITNMFPELKDFNLSDPNLFDKLKDGLNKPLVCGRGLSKASDCKDFGTMASILLNTSVKEIIPACKNKSTKCTLTECASNCGNDFVKDSAATILSKAKLARNASIALSYARPLLECNFVLEKLAGAMTRCDDLMTGSLLLGLGFFVGGLIFGLALYITLRGACIWGERFPRLRKGGSDK